MPWQPETRIEKKGKAIWVVVDHFVPGWTARLRLSGDHIFFDSVVEVRIEPRPVVRFSRREGERLVFRSEVPLRDIPPWPNFAVTAEILRKVPLSAPRSLDLSRYRPKPIEFPELGQDIEKMLRALERKRRRITPGELAHVARLYEEARRDSKTRGFAARAVADKLELPRQTVRNWLHKARKEGILPKTRMGYASDGLTKYGRKLLGVKAPDHKRRRRKK